MSGLALIFLYQGFLCIFVNMKAIVINAFTCKVDRNLYKVGDVYEANKIRIDELVAKGKVVVEVQHEPKAEQAHIPKAEKPKRNVKK